MREFVDLKVNIAKTETGIAMKYKEIDGKASPGFRKIVAKEFGFETRMFTMSEKEFIKEASQR